MHIASDKADHNWILDRSLHRFPFLESKASIGPKPREYSKLWTAWSHACLRHILNLVLLGIPTNYIHACIYIRIYIYFTYHISSLVAMTNHLYHVFWLPDTPWHTCCKLRKDILFGVIYTVELGVKLVGFKARFFKEPWRGQAPTCSVLM